MPEMFDGVPVCYGCIEKKVLETPEACLGCDHREGCQECSKEFEKCRNALRRDMRIAQRDKLLRGGEG